MLHFLLVFESMTTVIAGHADSMSENH